MKSVSSGLARELMNRGRRPNDPTGTGSGMTGDDYDKSVGSIDASHKVGFDVGPIVRER